MQEMLEMTVTLKLEFASGLSPPMASLTGPANRALHHPLVLVQSLTTP